MVSKSRLLLCLTMLTSGIMMLPFGSAKASADTAQDIDIADSTLVNVAYVIQPGFLSFDERGDRVGYGYEYLQEISKYTNWTYKYIDNISWNEALDDLKGNPTPEKRIDLVLGANYNEERALLYNYSEHSMGAISAIISAAQTSDLQEDDLPALDGLNIGYVTGDYVIKTIDEIEDKYHISLNRVAFSQLDQMIAELNKENSSIDIMVSTNMRETKNEKIIYREEPPGFIYALTRKIVGEQPNPLTAQLDYALKKIKYASPNYDNILADKYFNKVNRGTFIKSSEERTALLNKSTFTIVGGPDHKPFSSYEDGEYSGIVRDIMDLIGEMTGATFEYVTATDYQDALNKVKNDEADLLSNLYNDYNWAEENDLLMTQPYTSQKYVMISRTDYQPSEDTKVAYVPDYYFNRKFIFPKYPEDKRLAYSQVSQCFEAVQKGEADVTFCNIYIAQKSISQMTSAGLAMHYVVNAEHGLSMAFNRKINSTLFLMFDRAISYLDPNAIDEIILNHSFEIGEMTWENFFNRNYVVIVIFLSVVFAVFVILIVLIFYQNRSHQKHIHYLAYHDELTGLWNSSRFDEEFRKFMKNVHKHYALVFFKTTNINMINETYGRKLGDEVIKSIAKNLLDDFRKNGRIARYKSDEFYLLVSYVREEQLLQDISAFMGNHSSFEFNNIKLALVYQCGIYRVHDPKMSILESINFAREAIEVPHNTNRNFMNIFDDELEQQMLREEQINQLMNSALENEEFEVFFQPKYDIKTKMIIGAEALVRWNSPILGFLSPDVFIPIFENNGFIIELDFYVLDRTCRFIKNLINENEEPITISVNQSRAHLYEQNYLMRLRDIVDKYGIPKKYIELELTETTFQTVDIILDVMKKIRALGFTISVDDFGSGYSSLFLLTRFPFDVIKIDKSLIDDIEDSVHGRIILKNIVTMSKELDIDIICEGVERETQTIILNDLGIQKAQGYFFSRPIKSDKFKELLINKIIQS